VNGIGCTVQVKTGNGKLEGKNEEKPSMRVHHTMQCLSIGIALLILASPSAQAPPAPGIPLAAERFWPQWRGPQASGASRLANPPLEWSESRNIKWKVEMPGRGSASPVVWGDRIYLLTAVPAGVAGTASHQPVRGTPIHRYSVLAIDRRDGTIAWERTAREEQPHEGTHDENGTFASSSAVTDGEHLFAYFESRGLYAYDMQGKLLWEKDLGDKTMRNQFGEGSTPALYRDHLVVVWDHRGESFVAAVDKRTGKELWRVARNEVDTWATPLIVEHAGRAQVVTAGQNRLRSYDLETGRLVWESAGTTMNPIPSPVATDGIVVVTSGFAGSNLKAIRLAEAHGDITKSNAIVWTLDRDTPYVPSPLLYDGVLYLLKSNSGILSVFDVRTGTPHYQLQRLAGIPEVFSSPVGAAGRVYITSRDGQTLVIRHGAKFEVLAKNTLDDGFDASPAMVDNDIYLRGYRYLYAISQR
jgi:outer membrane protein assembly factor BamB